MKDIHHSNHVIIIEGEFKGMKGEIKKVNSYIDKTYHYLTDLIIPYKYINILSHNSEMIIKDINNLIDKQNNMYEIYSGDYQGVIGKLIEVNQKIPNELSINLIGYNKIITLTPSQFLYMDLRYELPDKQGFIQINYITDNNIINGIFINDADNSIENITLNLNDKNVIKSHFTFNEKNKSQKLLDDELSDNFVDENESNESNMNDDEDDEENNDKDYSSEMNEGENTYDLEYDSSENTENMIDYVHKKDSSEYIFDKLSSNDQETLKKIMTIMDNLSVNRSQIDINKTINYYNLIINSIEKIDNTVNSLDNELILYNIMMILLSKTIDISEFYKENKGNTAFLQYVNMFINKKFFTINKIDVSLSKFNKENFTNKFKLKSSKTKNDFYDICYNINQYIKFILPEFSDFEFHLYNKSLFSPVSVSKQFKQQEIIPVVSSKKTESDLEIKELEKKLKIAEAANNVEQIKKISEELEKIQSKKTKSITTIKPPQPYNDLNDYYFAFMDNLKNKLENAKKKNNTKVVIMYENIINNFLNLSIQDEKVNEYRTEFKNFYMNNIYHANLLKEMISKKKEFKNLPQKYDLWYKKYFVDDDHVNMEQFNIHFERQIKSLQSLKQISEKQLKKKEEREFDILTSQFKQTNISKETDDMSIEKKRKREDDDESDELDDENKKLSVRDRIMFKMNKRNRK